MHDKPTALEDFCVDALCDSVWAVCTAEKINSSDTNDDKNQPVFCESVSNKLLRRLNDKDYLTDDTMRFFTAPRTSLKHARIVVDSQMQFRNSVDRNISPSKRPARVTDLTLDGLCVLREHKLESLALVNMSHVDLNLFIERCINEWTKDNLFSLDVRGTFQYSPGFAGGLGNLEQFRNLRTLIVCETSFDDACLTRASVQLPFLDYLDIGHTRVRDIGPVLSAKDRLRTLIMYQLKLRSVAETVGILHMLYKLEVLDVSYYHKPSHTPKDNDKYGARIGVTLIGQSAERSTLSLLKICDVSGDQANFDPAEFELFLKTHDRLEFLGLLTTNACYFDSAINCTELIITGEANKKQILAALQTYVNREHFCTRSLYLLFSILQQGDEDHCLTDSERNLSIEHVLQSLKANCGSLSVQMAGTACLYNLCRGERATFIHPAVLRRIVECSLSAIENHSATLQLHKNVWLTLCNDHVLQSGAFNMFRCCTAALESMVSNSDSSITRMTVAIISILAAKIPVEETTQLGTNPEYMRFLLRVVSDKVATQASWYKSHNVDPEKPEDQLVAPSPDVTLKFTLSALWNLTDESPPTCRCLLDEDGLNVVIGVLDVFHDQSIETKVLGLLNNVAEVRDLKKCLLSSQSLRTITRLLKSPKIDVSYFAAGILAHLCAEHDWHDFSPTRIECLEALGDAIGLWKSPDNEMVAYRSFKPFFSLLLKDDLPQVQLWAVWAIKHVCSRNLDRYADLFKNEGGENAVEHVLRSSGDSLPLIKELCTEILKILT